MIREMGIMDHIAVHSIRVCQVALFLTDHLNEKGHHLNRDLIQAAALLHDITKTRSFETGENHAETAQVLIGDAGFPEVSHIVGQHVRLLKSLVTETLEEAEIINYSDKRVMHDHIVSLEERFAYIAGRYAKNDSDRARIASLTQKTKALEKRLYQYLPFSPASLKNQLRSEDFTADLKGYFTS